MTAPRYAIEAPADALDLVDRMASPLNCRPLTLTKRAAWVLGELLAAGPEGISKISYAGVNIGDAILKCRKAGVRIETQHEPHGGEFSGHHGRYVLQSRIVRLDVPTMRTPSSTTTAPQVTP